ncbi:MAG: hypothetical protein KGJ78_13035 [Alphaproteobacteria bacterium]|nr:hypothetical protein [Alphaproteobacteria bacterium]
MAKTDYSRFWVAGVIYWVVVIAALYLAVQIWPHLERSAPFFYAAVLGAVVGGFAIVYLMRSKP